MNVKNREELDQALAELCREYGLRAAGLRYQDRLYGELNQRFLDESLQVELKVSWNSEREGLHTLSIHTNSREETVLAHDSRDGRLYFFPEEWYAAASLLPAGEGPSEVEVNARSRFSVTPGGRPTGYKQQRFARDPDLYFQGSRIVRINDTPTDGQHTGQLLYEALRAQPDKVRLTLEGR